MRPGSAPWRVSDSVAYDVALHTADRAVVSGTTAVAGGADSGRDTKSIDSRVAVLQTDGFDRAAVASLNPPETIVPLAMDAGERDGSEVFRDGILPTVFMTALASDEPRFVLLGGQAGSGRSRAISRLANAEPHGAAVISSDLLGAFAGPVPDDSTTASWLLACMRHAREHRYSLLLDGPFPDPSAVDGILKTFEGEGYSAEVAVVAVPWAESLLAVASSYAIERRAGRQAQLTPLAIHDDQWRTTRSTLETVAAREPAVRTTVFDRAGAVVHEAGYGAGAVRAFDRAVDSPMSTLQAVQWLSELKRVTEYARRSRIEDPELTRYLVAAHEAAIGEVVPRLRVPTGSVVSRDLESRQASELVSLRRDTRTATADASAPTAPPSVGREGPFR